MEKLYNSLITLCKDTPDGIFYVSDHIPPDNNDKYFFRVFAYRLSSYSMFKLENALECRGIMFQMEYDNYGNIDNSGIVGAKYSGTPHSILARPMEKFFNYMENPMTDKIDLKKDMVLFIFRASPNVKYWCFV